MGYSTSFPLSAKWWLDCSFACLTIAQKTSHLFCQCIKGPAYLPPFLQKIKTLTFWWKGCVTCLFDKVEKHPLSDLFSSSTFLRGENGLIFTTDFHFLNSGKQRSHFCCWKVSRIWCYCCSLFPYSMAMQGWMVILWAHYATEPGHYTTIIMGPRRILGIAEESKFRGCFIKTTWERQERRESRNATRFRQAH